MLNVHTAESIISLITFFIAYAVSATIAGCFTAWVAFKMGDETAVEQGFFTLNPLMHIDMLGTVFLILYNFGWGRFIPINPFNIQGRFRLLKINIAFLAESTAHFILGILSMILLLALFGEKILIASYPLSQAFPNVSSYTISIALILISMLFVNIMLGVITFLVNMCGLVVMLVTEKYPQHMMYVSLIMIILPVVLYLLFGKLLLGIIFGFIKETGCFFASLLHLF